MTIEDIKDYMRVRAATHAKAHQDFFKVGDHEMSLYSLGKERALLDVLAHMDCLNEIEND